MGAHSAGRVVEALRPRERRMTADFLSGDAGDVTASVAARASGRSARSASPRPTAPRWSAGARTRLAAGDAAAPGAGPRRLPARLAAAAAHSGRCAPSATTCAWRSAPPRTPTRALARTRSPSGSAGGKFENLNRVLAAAGGEAAARAACDWLLVVDDDVRLPARFLDRFVALCERFAARPRPAGPDASAATPPGG